MGNLFVRENKPIGRTVTAFDYIIHYKLERLVDNHHRNEWRLITVISGSGYWTVSVTDTETSEKRSLIMNYWCQQTWQIGETTLFHLESLSDKLVFVWVTLRWLSEYKTASSNGVISGFDALVNAVTNLLENLLPLYIRCVCSKASHQKDRKRIQSSCLTVRGDVDIERSQVEHFNYPQQEACYRICICSPLRIHILDV